MARRPFFMSKSYNQLSLLIGSEFSLKDFSFSQLILAVKRLMDTEGVPGLIKALMGLVEMLVIKSGVSCPHCASQKYHVHSRNERGLKTSIGEVRLSLSRLRCNECGRTYCPLNKFLDLDPYSRKSREFEKLSLETVTNQSFRRSAIHLSDTMGFLTAHTTLHRWFRDTEATALHVTTRVDFLVADGTGYKRQKDSLGSNRGEVRVMLGYNQSGQVVPFGAWTRASWKDIGRLVKNKNHASERIKFKPIADSLVTDGEFELVEALKKLAKTHQRCLFHMTHELVPLLRYQDIVGKDEALKLSEELHEILYLDLPEQDADPLRSLEDKLNIEIRLKAMRQSIDEFIAELKSRGYRKARVFVENAKSQLFTYIENWLKTGIANPKVTSLVERTMREIKRRIKKIGFMWSEQGAEKMTRLVLLQLGSTKSYWENHWQEKMGINADIKLSFLGVTVKN
jgi:transposase-like protein